MTNIKLLLLLIAMIGLQSCNHGERKIKKFLSRLNARELDSSSEYVWPKDHSKLYVFNQRFVKDNELMSFELEDCNSFENNGSMSYFVKLKCNNPNNATIDYFKSIGKYRDGFIIDTIQIKNAHNKEYISFNWGWDTSYNSFEAKCYKITNQSVELKEKPKSKSHRVAVIEIGEEVIVDINFDDENWNKGFIIGDNGVIKSGYFKKENANLTEVKFFTLSWFASISIIYISLLAIVVLAIIYPLLFSALFRAGGSGAMDFAFKLFALLVIISIIVYQIIERALFEWFIINLPY